MVLLKSGGAYPVVAYRRRRGELTPHSADLLANLGSGHRTVSGPMTLKKQLAKVFIALNGRAPPIQTLALNCMRVCMLGRTPA
jgi:hypothetical protein